MPNSIDERVVQMTFDNKQFEQGVSTSLKTLDDLKKALNFDEVENSLKNIEEAFNGNKEIYRVGTLILHLDENGNYNIVDGQQRII